MPYAVGELVKDTSKPEGQQNGTITRINVGGVGELGDEGICIQFDHDQSYTAYLGQEVVDKIAYQ